MLLEFRLAIWLKKILVALQEYGKIMASFGCIIGMVLHLALIQRIILS